MFPPFFSFGPVRDLKSGSALEVGGSWFKLSQAASPGSSLGSSDGATSAGFLLTGVGVCKKIGGKNKFLAIARVGFTLFGVSHTTVNTN